MNDKIVNICIVDDSKAYIAYIIDLFKDNDEIKYNFITFNDIDRLFDQIDNLFVDIFLVDYDIPKKNGNEVIQNIRIYNKFKHIPVILLTGGIGNKSRTDQIFLEALKNGATDFLLKNEIKEIIIAKINNYILLKKSTDIMFEEKQIQAINALIATTKHEYNNALCISIHSMRNFFKKNPDLVDNNELLKVEQMQKRMAEVTKKLNEIQKIEYENDGTRDYLKIKKDN